MLLHFIKFVLAVPAHWKFWQSLCSVQCVPEKRKPINQVIFSENCNDLSEKAYMVRPPNLSDFGGKFPFFLYYLRFSALVHYFPKKLDY